MVVGFTSAYYGGIYDYIVRWLVDVLLTVPNLLILVVIASALGSETITINQTALIISLTAWMGPARVIRGQVLSMRERSYVLMARLNGMGSMGIIFRELIPNLLPYLGASLVGAVNGAIFASIWPGRAGVGYIARAAARCHHLLGATAECHAQWPVVVVCRARGHYCADLCHALYDLRGAGRIGQPTRATSSVNNCQLSIDNHNTVQHLPISQLELTPA